MKKASAIPFVLSMLLLFGVGVRPHSNSVTKALPGNIADGMYTIVGEASHRCLEVPNSSCATGIGLQTFDCDGSEASNNQKFNVASDGSGNYTISPVHSDLCLEVSTQKIAGPSRAQTGRSLICSIVCPTGRDPREGGRQFCGAGVSQSGSLAGIGRTGIPDPWSVEFRDTWR